MGDFESRVMKELESLSAMKEKLEGISTISARLEALEQKIGDQGGQIDMIQTKVNLAMTSLGEVQQEQVAVARAEKEKSLPTGSASQDAGILQPPPQPPFTAPLTSPRYTSMPRTHQLIRAGRARKEVRRKLGCPRWIFPSLMGRRRGSG